MYSELSEGDDGQVIFSVDKHNLLMSSCKNISADCVRQIDR